MARLDSWSCDVCRTQRTSSNHWWRVHRITGGAKVLEWDAEGEAVEDADAHLCGIQHTLEWLSKHILEAQQ